MIKDSFINAITASYSLRRIFQKSDKVGLRCLMYHSIDGKAIGDGNGFFTVRKEQFLIQMKLLKKINALKPMSLKDYQIKENMSQIAITFDDGYADNLDLAAPILVDLEIPFTVFISTNFVRTNFPGFLSPAGIRDLLTIPGASIGSHGDTHIPLNKCDDDQLIKELSRSKFYLEDLTGTPIQMLSYPYGAVDNRVKKIAERLNYQLAFCSYAGLNFLDRDPLLLRRTEINSKDDVSRFNNKILGNFDWYQWRKIDPAGL